MIKALSDQLSFQKAFFHLEPSTVLFAISPVSALPSNSSTIVYLKGKGFTPRSSVVFYPTPYKLPIYTDKNKKCYFYAPLVPQFCRGHENVYWISIKTGKKKLRTEKFPFHIRKSFFLYFF